MTALASPAERVAPAAPVLDAERDHGLAAAGRGGPAVIAAVSALGVLLVAVAYALGRANAPLAQLPYWAGQAAIFVPIAQRLLSRVPKSSGETVGLLGLLTVELYACKWMYSPVQLKFPDELQHLVGTADVVRTGSVGGFNAALPIASSFPGLETLAGAVATVTGLPLDVTAFIVAGVAHLAFVAVLFCVLRRITGTDRLAAIALLLYMGNAHFLFFDSMFIYQTIALPFFALSIWAVRAYRDEGMPRKRVIGVGMIAIPLTVTSHHITAAVLAATLIGIGLCDLLNRRQRRYLPAVLAAYAVAIDGVYFGHFAPGLGSYFAPFVRGLGDSLKQLVAGKNGNLLTGIQQLVTPLEDRLAGGIGVAVLAVLLLRALLGRGRLPADPWRVGLLVASIAFFVISGLRFVAADGSELAGRASTFVYVPAALVAAYGIGGMRDVAVRGVALRGVPDVRRVLLVTAVFVSGLSVGWPSWWNRLPGPFLVSGFERGVDQQTLNAAEWAKTVLGPNNRVAADVNNYTMMSTRGGQVGVRSVGSLYLEAHPSAASRRLVRDSAIRYLVVDERLSRQAPVGGSYFPDSGTVQTHFKRITAAELAKFGDVPRIALVYDSGTIKIYDLERSWYEY